MVGKSRAIFWIKIGYFKERNICEKKIRQFILMYISRVFIFAVRFFKFSRGFIFETILKFAKLKFCFSIFFPELILPYR